MADQAFTNAKAAGNTTGMVFSLLFRAIERNTGAVGTASALCNETAANPEVAAISQHQVSFLPAAYPDLELTTLAGPRVDQCRLHEQGHHARAREADRVRRR